MEMLAVELGLEPQTDMPKPPRQGHNVVAEHVYKVPYTSTGQLQRELGPRMTLDLRVGSLVRIVSQPDWDRERCGNVGTVSGCDQHGHYVIKLPQGGDRATRTLGSWWVDAALAGQVPCLPVCPCKGSDTPDE